MFIYRSLPSEVTRKYKTPQGVIRRINLDFPDINGIPHVFYAETETITNKKWSMVQVPKPTASYLALVAKYGKVLRRKVFLDTSPYEGWQLHGSEIIIRWED